MSNGRAPHPTEPGAQLDALHAIPAADMLVDPGKLAAVLEEPSPAGAVSMMALLGWTLASVIVTVGAAIWWIAAGY